MSVNNVSPQSFLGGTWQAWGAGKVPVGVDPNDTDFNASNKSGGSKTVVLTVKQMPSHSHGLEKKVPYGVPYNNTSGTSAGNGGGTFYGETYSPPFTVQSSGNGEAHQNMPPYLTVYMWRRIS